MKHFFTLGLALLFHFSLAQNTYTTRADFPGTPRNLGVAFTIGTKVYFGTGADASNNMLADIWEYDVVNNSWTQKNDFEGAARTGAVGFAINGKGYIGLGGTEEGTLIDLWEYNSASDDWTRVDDIPGDAPMGAFVFVANNKAYIGAGQDVVVGFHNEMWEYDPATGDWTQKASLPSAKRAFASAFAIGTKGYVGLGLDGNANTLTDFWEYNTANDQWTQKADYPVASASAVAFATSTRGYIGPGTERVIWSYYPNEDGWVKEGEFPAAGYANASCAFANGKAYFANSFLFDETLFQYTPASDQSITFNALPAKTFGDAAFSLTATATSSLPVSFASSNTSIAVITGNTATIVGAGTCFITATQSGNGTFDPAATIKRTLTVNKLGQTITFGALDDRDVHEAPFNLTATASSDLAVSFSSSNTSVATVSGSTVTIVGAGTTTITANQPGNTNYAAAPGVDQSLTVTTGITKWIGSLPTTGGYGTGITLDLHLNDGLQYTLTSSNTNVATVAIEGSSWVVTPTGLGTTTLTASNSGNAEYPAAPTLTADLVISKGTQTITFADIPPTTYGDGGFLVFPAASSGLAVTLETDATHDEIQIAGNQITPTMSYTGTITAKQAGNDFYLPATPVVKAINVSRRDQAIQMDAIAEKMVGDAPFRPALVPDLSIGLSSSNTAVAVIDAGLVKIVGAGTTTITATRAQDFRQTAASTSKQLVVKQSHTIDFTTIGEKNIGDAAFQVTATASSALPVTFSSSDPAVATVSGNTVTIVGAGPAYIRATAGDATYATTTSSQLLVVRNPNQPAAEQGQLWGVQMFGGKYGAGGVFMTNADGTGVNYVKHFNGGQDIGSNPLGSLTLASNGKYYGNTTKGGAHSFGMLFEYDATSGVLTKKFDYFLADVPSSKWAASSNGKLYGVKSADGDGVYHGDMICEFDVATGTFTKFLQIPNSNSMGVVFISSAGKIYATTYNQTSGNFAVHEYNPSSNSVTQVATSTALLTNAVEMPNGKFYGTTVLGGANGEGYIFEFDPAGTVTAKVDFEKAGFNTTSAQGLMRASNGKLYGVAVYGGPGKVGYIFEYDPAQNKLTKLASFPAFVGQPSGLMTEGPDGKLYGTGTFSARYGHIFQFDPATNNLVIQALATDDTGKNLFGDLVRAGDKFLGLAQDGGANNAGVLYEYDYATRVMQRKVDFGGGGAADGWFPLSDVVPASNGKVYGLTKLGGVNNVGTMYEIDPATGEYKKVYDFGTSEIGSTPLRSLISGYNGKLYGATTAGGAYNGGTVFEFDPSNGAMQLVHAVGLTGYPIQGKLAQSKSGKLYGAAGFSGDTGNGTLIEIDPVTKEAKKLFAFVGSDQGHYPNNGLMIASNGKLYGTTEAGGTNDKGVLFEFDLTTNTYTARFHFDGAQGEGPTGILTEVNGKLYGVTPRGGASQSGILFEYDPATGTYTVKKDFATVGGGNPGGSLLLAANGKLYGNTASSAIYNAGNIFEYDLATNALAVKQQLTAGGSWDYVKTSLSQTTKASRRDQSITIDAIGAKVLGQPAFTPTATATSGLAVAFTAGNDKVTVANNSVTMVKAGKATLKANQSGGPGFTAAAEVQTTFCINPAKPNITSSGANTGTMQLTSSNTSGNQWYKDGTAIAAATSASLSVTQPGVYTVQTTVEECVGEVSAGFPIIITGDVDTNNDLLALYPNPVQDRLYINLPGGNLKRITLLQTDGRIAEEHHTSEQILEIDVRNYSAGLYLVRVADENGTRPTIKFIKK